MSVNFTKRNVQAMAEVLNDDYESVEEAAKAALEAAQEIIDSRAAFTVVGQVKHPDNKGDKIALGWYVTEKQALGDAFKLTYSAQTHEEHWAWVLPVFHGTPNDYYIARKKAKQQREIEASAAKVRERHDDIESRYAERELKRRVEWVEENPGQPIPEEWGVFVEPNRKTEQCWLCEGAGRIPQTERSSA